MYKDQEVFYTSSGSSLFPIHYDAIKKKYIDVG